ncbi:MAG TPA: transposase, partial [Methylobacter sp.]
MEFNSVIHHRKSIRLKNYDYSQAGLYFITVCIEGRHCLFGHILNDSMILNDVGKMISSQWNELDNRFLSIALHEYVVMPNHFHGIIEFVGDVGAIPCGCPSPRNPDPTIGDVVGAFKSLSTNEYIQNVKQNNWQPFAGKLWQRNYYE